MKYDTLIADANQELLKWEHEVQRLSREMEDARAQRDKWKAFRDLTKELEKNRGRKDRPAPTRDIGIAEGIKIILSNNPDGLTPPQIRDQLRGYGITAKTEKHFLSNVHTILKGMKDVEAVFDQGKWTRKVYRLKK